MKNRVVRTTVYMPYQLHTSLKEDAFYNGKSFNHLILEKLEGGYAKKPLKIKAFDIRVAGNLGRKEIYNDILNHRG